MEGGRKKMVWSGIEVDNGCLAENGSVMSG